MSEWTLSMVAEPIVPAWTTENDCNVNGAELQRAILRGFADRKKMQFGAISTKLSLLKKTFTFKEHGEFFRGALTMAGLRYTGDFFELLQRYGTIKVTITKHLSDKTKPGD